MSTTYEFKVLKNAGRVALKNDATGLTEGFVNV